MSYNRDAVFENVEFVQPIIFFVAPRQYKSTTAPFMPSTSSLTSGSCEKMILSPYLFVISFLTLSSSDDK